MCFIIYIELLDTMRREKEERAVSEQRRFNRLRCLSIRCTLASILDRRRRRHTTTHTRIHTHIHPHTHNYTLRGINGDFLYIITITIEL